MVYNEAETKDVLGSPMPTSSGLTTSFIQPLLGSLSDSRSG